MMLLEFERPNPMTGRKFKVLGKVFLLDRHQKPACNCSYCQEHRYSGVGSFGFKAAIDQAPNAWLVVYWVTKSSCHYIRWTRGGKPSKT